MWTLNWGTVSSHRRHSYAVPVQWLSGHPSPSTHTSLSAPPFALPPTGGCPRTFPNTGTTSTSPGHHHPARQPQLWRDTQPRLPPPAPLLPLQLRVRVTDARSLSGPCPQTPAARVVPERLACQHRGWGGALSGVCL